MTAWTTRAPQRAVRSARALMLVLPVVLITSLLAGVPALAAPTPQPSVQRVPSVPGKNIKPGKPPQPVPFPKIAGAQPAPRWPAPGVVDLEVGDLNPQGVKIDTLAISAARTTVAARTTSPSPSRIRVEVLDRDRLGAAGQRFGVLMRVGSADVSAVDGQASIRLDYRAFRNAAGGDWAARLRIVRLPECGLTQPDAPGCQPTVLPGRNDVTNGVVTADIETATVPMPATGRAVRVPDGGERFTTRSVPTLLALEAGAKSGAGDYAATGLAPSATWSGGGMTGDFTWSYPLRTPPSLGGPAPNLKLAYSAQSVDGRTAASNNQPSWIGEGFEYSPGFIERRYRSCAEDMGNGASNAQKTGDLCWSTDNAVLSLNGNATELIRDDATGAWHPRIDDGSRVERLTGAANGDNDGEYWKITAPTGNQYFFGLHRLPGWSSGKPGTDSTQTAPVYGNHAGEPCRTGSFDTSWCQQAYRWNLDYVVDPRGNTMSMWYALEHNHYARQSDSRKITPYVRGGVLAKIDYGTHNRGGVETALTGNPPQRVLFSTLDRCAASGAACDSSVKSNWANWPDTPWDLNCSSTTCNVGSPTFWTSKRLSEVRTYVLGGTGYRDVESWSFTHSYPDPQDGTRAGLWLSTIRHTGLAGGNAAVPDTVLEPENKPNRVNPGGLGAAMHWSRLKKITSETGALTEITYSGADCVHNGRMPASADTNIMRCFPVYWVPEGFTDPQLDWFHKYVVTQVIQTDTTGKTPTYHPNVVTSYSYHGDPAWHFDDDDGLVPAGRKTWSQWRGYARIGVTMGTGNDQRTYSETRYFRGMHGDKLAGGGTRSVQVAAEPAAGVPAVDDNDAYAGIVREKITYLGLGGTEVGATVMEPWQSPPTSSRTINGNTVQARYLNVAATHERVALDGGRGYRRTAKSSTFDAYGRAVVADDLGEVDRTGDEMCSRASYAPHTSLYRLDLPARLTTFARSCAESANPSTLGRDDVISDRRISYDGGDWSGAPTRGDVTRVEELLDWMDGAPVYRTSSRAVYDGYGRPTESWDLLGNRTVQEYTPAVDAPVTQAKTTNSLGWTTTTSIDPAWGSPTEQVDVNGKRTSFALDPLGRLTAVWLPNRNRAQETANVTYTYEVRNNAPTVVTTNKLNPAGNYLTSFELYDSLLRPRQTQHPSPVGSGRVVTDSFYDTVSRPYLSYNAYYNSDPPARELFPVANSGMVPNQVRTEFDGGSRKTASVFQPGGVERWRTTTTYGGDHADVTPVAGATATSTRTDAHGRTVELRQFHGPTPTGAYDATQYGYDRKGRLTMIIDPAGNRWTRTYDLRGNLLESRDPDSGESLYSYDQYDRLHTSRDGRGRVLAFSYDAVGRPTGTYDDEVVDAKKRITYTYDTLRDGKVVRGVQASATRWVDGNAYVTSVDGFTDLYQPTGSSVVIPASEGNLAGTYTTTTMYNVDGTPSVIGYPAAAKAGLRKEVVSYGYDALGLPRTVQGTTTYVTSTTYSELGDLLGYVASTGTGTRLYQGYTYETTTGRLASRSTTRTAGAPQALANVRYSYNDAGLITKMADDPGGADRAETQCFRYDHLVRLTEAWTAGSGDCAVAPTTDNLGSGPAPYWHSWTYDVTGNRTGEVRHVGPQGAAATTYTYPPAGQPQPHAHKESTRTQGGTSKTAAFTYDSAGNMLTRPGRSGDQTLTWDSEGRLAKLTEAGAENSYVYDATGQRLISRDATGSTLYLGVVELRLTKSTGQVSATRYYSGPGGVVAQRAGSTLTWLAGDHQGTGTIAVNAANQEYAQRRQDPFGNPRGATPDWVNPRGFVGGVKDPTGLTHLGAREYDPETGRFVSVDPIADFANPQQLNGYAYAYNSPISSSDPSGLYGIAPMIEGDMPCGGAAGWQGCNKSQPCELKGNCSEHYDWPTDPIENELAHNLLDACGFVPAGGMACDTAHVVLYLTEGNDDQATMYAEAIALDAMLAGEGGAFVQIAAQNARRAARAEAWLKKMARVKAAAAEADSVRNEIKELKDAARKAAKENKETPPPKAGDGNSAGGGNGGGSGAPSAPRASEPSRPSPGEIPPIIYRGGTPSPSNLKLRPDEDALSFRDSLSNPLLPGKPVLHPGKPYLGIDATRLPPGSVVVDGVPGSATTPPGHVSVYIDNVELLQSLVIERGKFPK